MLVAGEPVQVGRESEVARLIAQRHGLVVAAGEFVGGAGEIEHSPGIDHPRPADCASHILPVQPAGVHTPDGGISPVLAVLVEVVPTPAAIETMVLAGVEINAILECSVSP